MRTSTRTVSPTEPHAGAERSRAPDDELRRAGLRWSHNSGRLLEGLRDVVSEHPRLVARAEALRHRRDTLLVKTEAYDRHRGARRATARRELESALADLRDSWRSVLGALDRESLYP